MIFYQAFLRAYIQKVLSSILYNNVFSFWHIFWQFFDILSGHMFWHAGWHIIYTCIFWHPISAYLTYLPWSGILSDIYHFDIFWHSMWHSHILSNLSDIWWSWRSGWLSWRLGDDNEWEKEEEAQDVLFKSRDPHLAGGVTFKFLLCLFGGCYTQNE